MKLSLSFIKDGISTAGVFLKETRAEARKVIWPGRQYVLAATLIILFIVFIAGVFVIFIDSVFVRFFGYLMKLY